MIIVGQEAIASVFGVAPKTIVQWQAAGFPVAVRGRPGVPSEYETAACIRWAIDRAVKSVQGESPADRLARLKADEIEMNLSERRGVLVRADAIEPQIRAAVVTGRETLLSAAPDLARAAEGKSAAEIEPMLAQAFEALLHQLANWRSAQGEDDDGDDDDGDDEAAVDEAAAA